MKLKDFIKVLQDESIDQESEVDYVIVYNPNEKVYKI